MELLMSGVGIVLSIAQLIPVFTVRNVGKKVFLVVTAGVSLCLFATFFLRNWGYRQRVQSIKQDVVAVLESGPKPWDSVFENMYDTDFDATNEAFDELKAEGRLKFDWVTVKDESGRQLRVKVYSILPQR